MNMHTEEREKELKKYIPIPLNRWGSPEDIGAAVVFMASNASSWVTGQCLFVDGGTQDSTGISIKIIKPEGLAFINFKVPS